jgi:uncharacterized protein with gpF-like domain
MMAINYRNLPFDEAIAFFRNKITLPSERWTDVWKDSHDVGFMVAGAAKADLLNDLRKAIDKAISEGTTLEEFRRDFDEIITRTGWDYKGGRGWRTRVIYETNLRTAYAAGRHAQLTDPDLLRVRPYWRYLHGGSADPREEHLKWDGMVLRADDPWWRTHYPPNGWGCSCKVVALSEHDLERMGLKVVEAPIIETYAWTDPGTGKVHYVPEGQDPGWDYAPGRTVAGRIRATVAQKRKGLPDVLGNAMMSELAKRLGKGPEELE